KSEALFLTEKVRSSVLSMSVGSNVNGWKLAETCLKEAGQMPCYTFCDKLSQLIVGIQSTTSGTSEVRRLLCWPAWAAGCVTFREKSVSGGSK
ncbi:MAG: hypothetical protein II058_01815, partial [Rhodocyclaceae bacterium]|nr:hypothetical protein [Rhodocyclaceae bacterium]